MAKLKKMLTHPGKNESGQGVLAIVLLFLMLGAVILTPLLVFMSTGVKSGQVYESKLQEFYAADSGVEAAMCNISQNDTAPSVPDYRLNDRNVTVPIEDKGGGFYKIISTATSDDGGSTTIECYVLNIAGFNLFDNAITSNGTVDIKGDVNGSIVAQDCGGIPNCNETQVNWPSEEQLSTWYWDDVESLTPVPDGYVINIPSGTTEEDPYVIGPLSAAGNLTIKGEGWIELGGTIYVKGDLDFAATPTININLNGRTIFAEGEIYMPPGVIIYGSGCIIAVGDVTFQPSIAAGSENEFVFIMSVEGIVKLQPVGNFYGAIAGEAEVDLWPNTNLTWTAVGAGEVNFPTEGMGMMIVLSYTLK